MSDVLMCDKELASLLRMSPSWVRVQRHKRKAGQEHILTVNPIMIGTSPRYKKSDIETWMDSLPQGGNHV